MFAYVTKTRISPRRASEFVKTYFSSDEIVNRTRIFVIGDDDWSEKTGNVSFFVEVSAFNRNYSVWQNQTQNSRTQDWRWQIFEYRINLTILHHSKYMLAKRASRIFCFNGLRQTITARENCEKIFSKNLTIDDFGKMTLLLGDYMSFPDNFKKLFNDGDSELKSIFKIDLIYHKLNHTIEC